MQYCRQSTICNVSILLTPNTRPVADDAMPLGRVAKSTIRIEVADRLRQAILGGDLLPGSPLIETMLAAQFQVSRAPLREAIRQLAEEGLVVTVPYIGTRVMALSVDDLREIQSMRVTLERFAFRQAWSRRDAEFSRELRRRHDALTAAIDKGDDASSISAELALHGLVYEASGHRLLLRAWESLRGKLQLYWAAHHRAHGSRGPRRDSHDQYVNLALGDDLRAMLAEVTSHMKRGSEVTERFVKSLSTNSTEGVTR